MFVKNLVLGIGIVVVFALVLWQGIEAFYPSPQYEDYCGKISPRPLAPDKIETQTSCIENGGVWQAQGQYCDYYFECQKNFDTQRNAHSRIVFFVALIVGMIALIVGFSILSIEPVGSALIGSGIWSFFWGTVVNWTNISNIWRFLLLLLALILLITIAVRINSQKKKGFLQKIGIRK